MLNYIWLALIALGVILGGFTGKVREVSEAAISSAETAVKLALGLIAVMTLWLGLMRLADKAGLVARLGQLLRPIMRWLFPEVPRNHPALGAIVMNMAANILGLNNAATPLGLRAMSELEKLNRHPGTATNAMCMLLAVNTSSITLIPVTVIALLATAKGKNPTSIIATSLAATFIAHAAAILTCKLLENSRWYRLPPAPQDAPPADVPKPEATPAATEPAAAPKADEQAVQVDSTLPWVPYARPILALLALVFAAVFWLTAFPETIGRTVPPEELSRFFLLRMIDALSILAIPWLILLFPLYAMLRRVPVYDEFVEGGKEGFNVSIRILPYVVAMLVAIGMFRAAGGLDLLTGLLRPLTNLVGFPPELVPLAVIRPFSGSASLGIFSDLLKTYGPDHFLTLTAATLYGCSETTFYVIAVYFGSVGVTRTRHAVPAGIVADIMGPVASVIVCRWVFGV
ncbi:MAG: spore maturation protein [Verrucomicrobia bacterium]|nr:spore maturation protein [Verrucomicrobiota bacterium]